MNVKIGLKKKSNGVLFIGSANIELIKVEMSTKHIKLIFNINAK